MTLLSFLALFLFSLCNTVLSYYIQTKRFDYEPSALLMYNQMYSHEKWRPYQYEIVDEGSAPNWEELQDVDKRVTADQINSLLKNAWLGR